MSVTINAHQLGRLIDKTSDHMGSEYVEPLHGIRLDTDARYLHAVATDRYTFAVARYALSSDDVDQEPWSVLLPAEHIPTVREWLRAMKGDSWITIGLNEGRLTFEFARTSLSLAVNLGLEFPDWRGILRRLAENSVEGEPFPCLNSSYLARFDTGDILRIRHVADEKAVLLFGEDFMGAVVPARFSGVGPVEMGSFADSFNAWYWTLAAGSKDAVMSGTAFEEDRPRYEVTHDVRETGAVLLKQVLRSTSDMFGKSLDDPDAFQAFVLAGVNSWSAYRFLDALHTADPRLAAQVVADTAEQLDSGEIGEWAWDAATAAGHDPQKWHDDYEAHLKKRAEKRAAEAAKSETAASATT